MLSEHGGTALHGAAYEHVAALVDGQRSAEQIVDLVADKVDATRAYYALEIMRARGVLAESVPGFRSEFAAFWHSAGIEPDAADRALREKRVFVQTIGNCDPGALQVSLQGCGVLQGTREESALSIVLTPDYTHEDLAQVNATALEASRPWLLVRSGGPELWIGPLFLPRETGCWACLRYRLIRNRPFHDLARRAAARQGATSFEAGAMPATEAAVCQMAAVAAAQFLAGAPANLAGKMLSLDWATFAPASHALTRHPHCPACGTAQVASIQPFLVESGRATHLSDGGHRSVSPETTFRKYEHHVSPITGIVRALEPVLAEDGAVQVYAAGQNGAVGLETLADVKRGLRSGSAGKGVSAAQAKASALCEALERYSGVATGGEWRVRRAFQDWDEGLAFHPNTIMGYSERQYAEREQWNARGSRFNRVPEPLDNATPVDWSPLWSLTEQRHKYFPTQLVYFQSTATEGDRTMYSVGCSNGNASGNTREEAVLQGFFELVERDAVALWWYNRLPKRGVALETFGDAYLLDMVAHYRQRGRSAWALDLTSDLGIPVFVAISRFTEGGPEKILFGLGCHLDSRIAVQRAFAEMGQMLALAGETGGPPVEEGEVLDWLRNSTVANQPYLVADPAKVPAKREDFPRQHTGDFAKDIDHCRAIVEGKGMEMLVLDQTRADVGMPVVKVVVPGLRHFWARYAPGRLYDVPVQMGWLKESLAESDLNPIPIFI